MNYLKTLSDTWRITWKNKILWIYGVVLAVSATVFITINQIGNKGTLNSTEVKVLEIEIRAFAERYWVGIIITAVAVLIIFCLIIWVSVISEIGLIHEANTAYRNDNVNLKRGWKKGREKFWQVVGLEILIGAVEFLVILMVRMPLSVLYRNGALAVAIPLTVFIILVLIPFLLIAFSVQILGIRKIIIDDKKIFQAILESYNLFIDYWKKIIITLLILISTVVVTAFLYTIVCLILLLPVAIIALIIASLIGINSGGVPIGIFIFVIPAIPFSVFAIMMATVFKESLWSVFYEKIKRLSAERK